jgi:predicted CXXCH cytochrome family protein
MEIRRRSPENLRPVRAPAAPPHPVEPGRLALLSAALLTLATVASASAAFAQGDAQAELETCLSCHGDETAVLDLPSGEKVSLFVDVRVLERSAHGTRVRCTQCHPGMDEIPHPERAVKGRREYQATFRDACRRCHFDNYTKTLDSVHSEVLAKGDFRAPVCADCHGAHDVTKAATPRVKISQTCARCHEAIFSTYSKSVHGKALVTENNQDVPVCTDCHHSHDIQDPRTSAYRLGTPQACGSCHTNDKVMSKYGLSTKVVSTYLSDFHGMSASLYKDQKGDPRVVVAVCIDCHGVHDIGRVRDAGAQALKSNLVKTCRKCHPTASESFPAAWLSHYEPSLKRAPLVYGVQLFYKIFIPFIIGGLCLQILLHLWRVVVNR